MIDLTGTFWVYSSGVEALGHAGDDLIVGNEAGVEAIPPAGHIDMTEFWQRFSSGELSD